MTSFWVGHCSEIVWCEQHTQWDEQSWEGARLCEMKANAVRGSELCLYNEGFQRQHPGESFDQGAGVCSEHTAHQNTCKQWHDS